MSDQLQRELQELGILELEELRSFARRRWGKAPKLRSVELMRLQLAWKIQAEAADGLDDFTCRQLKRTGKVQTEGLSLGAGARLRREWQGRTVEVVVEDGGFRWEDRRFKSLSAAATAIAGTRWNGPRFFGLRETGR